MKKKIGIILSIIIAIMLIGGIVYNVYARYVLSKRVSISFDTADYYFDVEVDRTQITSFPATINVSVKNYEGENFTDTDLQYNITVNEGYTIQINDEKIERNLQGNKKNEDSFVITINKNENYNTQLINLQFNVKKPYTDNIIKKIAYNEEYKFDYTGNPQEFIAKETGIYKLETWGAQGGDISYDYYGGYGGYSVGTVELEKNDKLYIYVGAKGEDSLVSAEPHRTVGGYNGGGYGYVQSKTGKLFAGAGGGATHIATKEGLLSELENYKENVLIVSGAGAGAYGYGNSTATTWWNGNSGGGYIGGYSYEKGRAGTQSTGYSFGQAYATIDDYVTNANYSGGGGGYYGGYGSWGERGAGGGSGYIGNPLLKSYNNIRKAMYAYNCDESSESATYTVSTTNVSEVATPMYAKIGNGYAKITFIGQE